MVVIQVSTPKPSDLAGSRIDAGIDIQELAQRFTSTLGEPARDLDTEAQRLAAAHAVLAAALQHRP